MPSARTGKGVCASRAPLISLGPSAAGTSSDYELTLQTAAGGALDPCCRAELPLVLLKVFPSTEVQGFRAAGGGGRRGHGRDSLPAACRELLGFERVPWFPRLCDGVAGYLPRQDFLWMKRVNTHTQPRKRL